MNWLSKGEAVGRFMLGGDVRAAMIDLPRLVMLIHEALALDGHKVEIERIWQEVIIPPMREENSDDSAGSDERFQRPTVVYLYYAEWVAGIGQLLGLDPDCDIQPDWSEQNPHLWIVVKAMANVAARVSVAAEIAYEAHHGHSMMEVFLASNETGEDFGQSRARLTAQRRGLSLAN